MSTDWGIGCRDCYAKYEVPGEHPQSPEYFSGEWDNCRNIEALKVLCDATEEILILADKIRDQLVLTWTLDGDVGSFGGTCSSLVSFLRQHRGHRLAPMNEYREFYDQCGEYIPCPTCNRRFRCSLKSPHEGTCKP